MRNCMKMACPRRLEFGLCEAGDVRYSCAVGGSPGSAGVGSGAVDVGSATPDSEESDNCGSCGCFRGEGWII